MAAPTRFVILAAPRTGSNWLCTLLDSHPEVLCHHEIFNPQGIHLALSRRGALDLGTVAERDADPAAALARLWRHDFGCRAVGLKITRDTSPAAFAAVFAERGLKAIVLSRRNRVKTFVSERIAALTGQWESHGLESHPGAQTHRAAAGLEGGPPRIEVEREELLAQIERNERYYAWLRGELERTGWETLETTYEALAAGGEQRRILAFLGVAPGVPLRGSTRKQNPDDLSHLISNFDRLAAALCGSDLATELHARET